MLTSVLHSSRANTLASPNRLYLPPGVAGLPMAAPAHRGVAFQLSANRTRVTQCIDEEPRRARIVPMADPRQGSLFIHNPSANRTKAEADVVLTRGMIDVLFPKKGGRS